VVVRSRRPGIASGTPLAPVARSDDDAQLAEDPLTRLIEAGYRDLDARAVGPRAGGRYRPVALSVDVFIIANAETVMSRSSSELMADVFPEVPVRHPLGEHETLLSIDKVRHVLGYEPLHSWRNERVSPTPER
jgi:hypothetical protein